MRILAVDAGTSAVKAAALEAGGTVAAVCRRAVPRSLRGPDGGLPPERLWDVTAEAIAGVTSGSGPVDAAVVTGQGDGLWTLDDGGRPAGPAYEWNSTVAGAVLADWEASGLIERHFRRAGTVLWPGTAAALWRWAETQHRGIVEATATVLCAKDWINHELCGAVATDVTDATIPFLDIEGGCYSDELIGGLGCEALRDRLAPIVPIGTEIGRVGRSAASRTGLRQGTPVLMGCIDVAAVVAGAGLHSPGAALAVLGTTAAAMAITDGVELNGEPAGATLKLPGPSRFLRVMGAVSGTAVLDWYLETFDDAGTDGHGRFWDDVSVGRPGVVMLPYLAGERAPFLAPDATGAFVGLTPATRRADLARATALGVTFSLRQCLDAAVGGSAGGVVLSGGGAASEHWCQMTADVLGRRIDVDRRPHVACSGVAALATGDRSFSRPDFATFEPAADYATEYRTFTELGGHFRPVWEATPRPPARGHA